MKEVVRWYVSGFYKTPKGVKKPYNPILGEKFRCYFKNEETNSRTFYIAEQVCQCNVLVVSYLYVFRYIIILTDRCRVCFNNTYWSCSHLMLIEQNRQLHAQFLF